MKITQSSVYHYKYSRKAARNYYSKCICETGFHAAQARLNCFLKKYVFELSIFLILSPKDYSPVPLCSTFKWILTWLRSIMYSCRNFYLKMDIVCLNLPLFSSIQ